jgi:hypothetical protein
LPAPGHGAGFGLSVAISGSTIVAASPAVGLADVFTKAGSGWQESAALNAPGGFNPNSATSVAISGSTIVVGNNGQARGGEAYVLTKSGTGWHLSADLEGSDTVAKDNFGSAVAISGATVVIGADLHAKKAGRAYVFNV